MQQDNEFLTIFEGLTDYDQAIADENFTRTENGAIAHASTGSAVLDFFSKGGALRSRDENGIISLFDKAYAEDPLLALKAMFYFRDVRGGQGERRTFRILLAHLAKFDPKTVNDNIRLIALYGRWDDLFVLLGTELEQTVYNVIDVQLALDKQAEQPSLLAKWLKSENASSIVSMKIARKIRKALGMSSREYRKTLSALRNKIGIVEQNMSRQNWKAIEYGKIPSKAGLIYRNAFKRHDGDRYQNFINRVNAGDETMNAGTLYPYEIVGKCSGGGRSEYETTLNAMWSNLPNYFEGNDGVRGMAVADVSGSMGGRPMEVSISLAIYTAERNTGPFAGKYITFSDQPQLITIDSNDSIGDKVRKVKSTDIGYSTNVEAVFNVILRAAIDGKLSQEDLPTHLYMISDMEFNNIQSVYHWNREAQAKEVTKTLFDEIGERYKAAGYKMPFLVFWNVDARNDQSPMKMDERGFQLVSGCSPSIFTSLLSNKAVSAYDLMLEVLNGDRYAPIKVG